MLKKENDFNVVITVPEKELLREIIKSEKANVSVFGLPDRNQQVKYQKMLDHLDGKFA